MLNTSSSYTISIESGSPQVQEYDTFPSTISTAVQIRAKWILTTLQLFLGDCLIVRNLSYPIQSLECNQVQIYRVYLVWMRQKKVIIFPAVMIIAVLGNEFIYHSRKLTEIVWSQHLEFLRLLYLTSTYQTSRCWLPLFCG